MNLLLIFLFLGLQASFIWARYARFRVQGRPSLGVRVIEASTVVCTVLGVSFLLQREGAPPWADAAALLLGAASAAMFAWGCGSVRPMQLAGAFMGDRPTELVQEGAFRHVRNPFYLSYILAHTVPLAAASSAWAAVPLLWMVALYGRAAAQEERILLAGPLAQEYRDYARRTGRFLPRLVSHEHA